MHKLIRYFYRRLKILSMLLINNMPFIIAIWTPVKAVIDTTESCTFSIMVWILTVIAMQLLRKLKKKLLSRQRGKQQKTTTKTKPNWLKEGDGTTGVSLLTTGQNWHVYCCEDRQGSSGPFSSSLISQNRTAVICTQWTFFVRAINPEINAIRDEPVNLMCLSPCLFVLVLFVVYLFF